MKPARTFDASSNPSPAPDSSQHLIPEALNGIDTRRKIVTPFPCCLTDPQHWKDEGRRDIQRAWTLRPEYGVAKNTILYIGDGMGLQSVTAGRIYKGQKMGRSGEEYKLSFEDFPYTGLSKTYNVDRQVADSAGTAVAMVSGVKANLGTLGVTSEVAYGKSCDTYSDSRRVVTALDYALQEGKSVGLITTTRVTHATPAAIYAHTPFRDWESDTNMDGITGCDEVKDIAYQLVMDNPNIQVVLGGGRRSFLNNTTPDPRTGQISSSQRKDGLDLIEEWKKDKAARDENHSHVFTKGQFDAVDPDSTDYLLGLFSSSHMSYELERDSTADGQPSLAEMVDKAIRILKRNEKGFFLLVEGGRIDHAHHDNLGKLALGDMDAFDEAVKKGKEMTSTRDTLIIVTADHSHVFGMAGYPSRGNPILGLVDIVVPEEAPYDDMPYTTLTYSNGPSYERVNYTGVDITGNRFTQQAGLGMQWETHAGEEVPIYARGPMAHLFHTTHEQSYIGHVIMYASCYGLYKNDCDLNRREEMLSGPPPCAAILGQRVSPIAFCLVAFITLSTATRKLFSFH
ncbi:alkaline phosphatase [Plakobranchus ocellatus]|uniref:alkaline phosphatase n=1 Tax=Plakobranchus ocellatus TaxID=259542 RepID=A0AAV3Y1H7_9GAST|nr:alkaline phosphatase [Plakobranchus ocellatus]